MSTLRPSLDSSLAKMVDGIDVARFRGARLNLLVIAECHWCVGNGCHLCLLGSEALGSETKNGPPETPLPVFTGMNLAVRRGPFTDQFGTVQPSGIFL